MRSFFSGRVIGALVAAGCLAGAPAASADETIYAGPPSTFYTSSVTIDQGEKATFTNLDTIEHDVTAAGKGPDGKPLFSTPLGGPGSTSDVAGVEFLTSGTYDFGCSIHPQMHGTLTVTTSGTPAPRPGSGSGSGSGSQPAPAQQSGDTQKPTVSLHVVDTRLRPVRARKGFRLHVTADEPVTVGLRATSGRTTVAAGTIRLDKAQTKPITLKLTKAGQKLVRTKRSLKVTFTANAADAAHNATSARAARTLRR